MSQLSVNQLFEAFIYYRQQGASPDVALQALRKLRPTISAEERQELVGFIRLWESTEGQNFPPVPEPQITPWTSEATRPQNIKRGTQKFTTATLAPFRTGPIEAIALLVKGHEDHPIVVNLNDRREIILGRATRDAVLLPDVDLTPYEGEEHGVSRVHATIKYQNDVVTIADMGSVNHTYLNGEMLHPQEVRVLSEGAEIRLGKLHLRPVYKRKTS